MDLPKVVLADGLLSDSDRAVLRLFVSFVDAEGSEREKLAIALADTLGNPGEFGAYLQGNAEERLIRSFHLMRVFRENMELLIDKTWVDHSEEKPKERLHEDLEALIADWRKNSIQSAFLRFVSIARSVPALLFGPTGRSPEFLEYAFRIDPKFGLFFWIVGELERQARSEMELADRATLFHLEILLGAYVLSSF